MPKCYYCSEEVIEIYYCTDCNEALCEGCAIKTPMDEYLCNECNEDRKENGHPVAM